MTSLSVPFNLNPRVPAPLDKRIQGTSDSSSRPTGNDVYTGLLRYETDTAGWVYYDGSGWQSVSFGGSGNFAPLDSPLFTTQIAFAGNDGTELVRVRTDPSSSILEVLDASNTQSMTAGVVSAGQFRQIPSAQVYSLFGTAMVGGHYASQHAYFTHWNFRNTNSSDTTLDTATNYAIRQNPVGNTQINCSAAADLTFRMGNQTMAKLGTFLVAGGTFLPEWDFSYEAMRLPTTINGGTGFLSAGTGIQITGGNTSAITITNTAPGVTYTQGDGINITGTTITCTVSPGITNPGYSFTNASKPILALTSTNVYKWQRLVAGAGIYITENTDDYTIGMTLPSTLLYTTSLATVTANWVFDPPNATTFNHEVMIVNANGTNTHFAYNDATGSENYIRGTRLNVDVSANFNVTATAINAQMGVNITGGNLSVTNFSTHTGGGRYTLQGGTDGGQGRGIHAWTATDPNWGMYMASPGAGKSLAGGTAVNGFFFTSHAIRFRVYNDANRGFIFENNNEQGNVSIRDDGYIYCSKAVYAANGYLGSMTWLTSDDRLKFDEVPVANGLSILRQLTPKRYLKSEQLNVRTDDMETEVGLIAQEVYQIPELRHCVVELVTVPNVEEPDPSTTANPIPQPANKKVWRHPESIDENSNQLELNYTDIHVYTIQAVKELDQLVQSQAALISALQARVAALESSQ